MNFDNTERTFGVELELILPEGMNPRELVRKLNDQFRNVTPLYWYGRIAARQQVDFVRASYSNKDNLWRVKPDCSIQGRGRQGVEVVTPILKGESDLATLKAVIAYLDHIGCTVNRSTGMHCHIDISDFNSHDLCRFMTLLAKYENAINAFLPNSRKGHNNSYCRNSFFGNESLTEIYKDLEGRAIRGSRDILNFNQFYGRGKWNFQNFLQHGTFENRAHSGTVNADKVEHWVRLTMGLISKAANDRIVPIANGATTSHSQYDSKSLLNCLARNGHISSQTKRFMNKRAKEISNAV